MSIIITFITQASLKYLQEPATILGPQNRTQGRCEVKLDVKLSFKLVDFTSKFGHNGLFLKFFDHK